MVRRLSKSQFLTVVDLDEESAEVRLYGTFAREKPYDPFGEEGHEEYITPYGFEDELEKLKGKKTAIFRFNSVGGDFFVGLEIASKIKQLGLHTVGIIEGLCASAATLPAVSLDELQAMPGTLLMYHEVTSVLCGAYQADDLEKELHAMEGINQAMAEMYHSKTGIETKQLLKDMKKETWLTAEQAKEQGFVDTVLEGEAPRMAASADRSMLLVNGVHIDVHNVDIPEDIPTNKRIHSALADENKKPAVDGGEKKEVEKAMTIDELREKEPELVKAIEDAAVEASAKADEEKQAEALKKAETEAEKVGHDAGFEEGRQASLKRYEDIRALIRTPDDEALADKAIRENMTPEQFATALVEADKVKGAAILDAMKADAKNAKAVGAAPHNETDNHDVDPYEYGRQLMKNLK